MLAQRLCPFVVASVGNLCKLRLEVHVDGTGVYYWLVSAVVKLLGLDFVTTWLKLVQMVQATLQIKFKQL